MPTSPTWVRFETTLGETRALPGASAISSTRRTHLNQTFLERAGIIFSRSSAIRPSSIYGTIAINSEKRKKQPCHAVFATLFEHTPRHCEVPRRRRWRPVAPITPSEPEDAGFQFFHRPTSFLNFPAMPFSRRRGSFGQSTSTRSIFRPCRARRPSPGSMPPRFHGPPR